MPDFYKNAQVLTPDEFAAQQQTLEAEPMAPMPPASAPVQASPVSTPPLAASPPPEADRPLDTATARMWHMQRDEVVATCRLLRQQADGHAFDAMEARELRRLLSSLVCTLATA